MLDPETHTLLVEHERAPPGEHVLSRNRPRYQPLQALLTEASRHGAAVATLCNILAQEVETEQARRQIRGVLQLARHHGSSPLIKACSAALDFGVPTYRFVRNYIKHHPGAPLSLRQIDPLIRELTSYRDVINELTGDTV